MNLNLGDSYPTYANTPVLQVITQGQGQTKTSEVQFPTGKKTSSVNIYSRTYKSPSQADAREVANYGKDDPYTATESNYQYPSMIASSAITGLIWSCDFICDCDSSWFSNGSLSRILGLTAKI